MLSLIKQDLSLFKLILYVLRNQNSIASVTAPQICYVCGQTSCFWRLARTKSDDELAKKFTWARGRELKPNYALFALGAVPSHEPIPSTGVAATPKPTAREQSVSRASLQNLFGLLLV